MTFTITKQGWLTHPLLLESGKEKEITFMDKLSGGSTVWGRITGLVEIFGKYLVHASPSTEQKDWAQQG